MIVLTRGYMIRSTPYSYALLRKEKTKNKKTGEESEYLSTMSEAIEALTRLSNQLLEEFRGTVIGDIL